MKKIIAGLIAFQLLVTSAFAADIKYTPYADDFEYDYAAKYIAKSKTTGEIIPMSYDLDEKYLYAYTDDDFELYVAQPVKFTDVYEYDYTIGELSARGIIQGNGDGTFLPGKELTRAEMAAIFTRMFSVKTGDYEAVFSDIKEDSWYAPYVTALYKNGVFKKDDKFNPDDIITKEQLVAMTYRMLLNTEKMHKVKEFDYNYYTDYSSVSDYAKDAYKTLVECGYMCMSECDENGTFDEFSDDIYYLEPQKPVSRQVCADFITYFIRDFFRFNAPAIKLDDFADIEIPKVDGSTSTYDITRNIYSMLYYNGDNNENMPLKHSKTSNSYKRLIDKEVDMIFVPDASNEIIKYAEEKNVKLKFVPIANEALVFFTGKDNPVKGLTTEQYREIYVNNKYKNWSELGGDDKKLAAFCRNNDSGSHAQMEKFILDGGELNSDITRERTSVIMASILSDVIVYDADNPNSRAMGYSLYYYFENAKMFYVSDDALVLMSADGVVPSDDTISSGQYPYTTNYYAVVRDEPNEINDKFIEFMQSDAGDEIISRAGLGVMKHK